MSTRILPPVEWHRLEQTDAREAWGFLDPERNRVIVDERDGLIVGCVILMTTEHAEFLWVKDGYRGHGTVLRRLRDRLMAEAHGPTVLVSAVSHQMRCILHKLGAQPLPGAHYVLTLKEMRSCLQR